VSTTVSCDDYDVVRTTGALLSPDVSILPSIAECDDGNSCSNDTCDEVLGCQYTPIDCGVSDNCTEPIINACTDDSCNDTYGCQYTPVDCDDGDFCTVALCDASNGCYYVPLVCNDNDTCTIDTCDESNQVCVYTPINCDDNNECTIDTCCEVNGLCVYTEVIYDACTDDSLTNPPDARIPLMYAKTTMLVRTNLVTNTPIVCDDDDACTIDSCDNSTGCVFTEYDCDDCRKAKHLFTPQFLLSS